MLTALGPPSPEEVQKKLDEATEKRRNYAVNKINTVYIPNINNFWIEISTSALVDKDSNAGDLNYADRRFLEKLYIQAGWKAWWNGYTFVLQLLQYPNC